MLCEKCGAEIGDGSSFCNKCGAAVQAAQPEEGQQQPFAPRKPEVDQEERAIWSGKPSARTYGAWMLAVAALGIIFLFVFLNLWLKTVQGLKWIGYGELIIFAICLVVLVWKVLWLKMTLRYRLTTQRLFIERGFFSKNIDELELIRVDDVSVHQNVIQRMFNVGDVKVMSTDVSDAQLVLRGIDNPIEVKERIREHTQKRRKKSVFLENL